MVLIYSTLFAGLAGLAFGSFLNVCVSRWPDEESVITPASYCDRCERSLKWWENIPLLSWLVLRGRCRTCKAPIGWRHPIVELAIGGLWAYTVWATLMLTPQQDFAALSYTAMLNAVALLIFEWLLVGLAALDAENLWLPDRLIFPGIGLGVLLSFARPALDTYYINGGFDEWKHRTGMSVAQWFLGIVIPTGIMLVIRHGYRVFRNKDGIGAGDVKLIAMLGGWLGVKVALLAFGLGVLSAAAYGLLLLANPTMRGSGDSWLEEKLPFGTFLSLGGIAGGLWGVPLVALYMRLTGMGS
jgi:leader peptidase (prepilin peptidase) / N-methyltransferase